MSRSIESSGDQTARTSTDLLADLAQLSVAAHDRKEWTSVVTASVLDTLAVALASREQPLIRAVSAGVPTAAHDRGSLIWVSGEHVDARTAAFANAVAAHALDFDDTSESLKGHLSGVVIPVLLAFCNPEDWSRTHGRRLVAAYAVGAQAALALSRTIDIETHYGAGWHATCTVGVVAAAVALSHLLGLSISETRTAIGLAATAASGMRAAFGTDAKPLQVGAAAESAVRAVQLSLAGARVDADLLDRPSGYFDLLGSRSEEMLSNDALRAISAPPLLRSSIKMFPCCYELQRPIAAALLLRQRAQAAHISSISLVVHPGGTQPLTLSWPRSTREAQFSPHFVLAQALSVGSVDLGSFNEARIRDRDLIELGRRVHVREAGACAGEGGFAELSVTLRDGEQLDCRVDLPPGHSSVELDHSTFGTKVAGCLRFIGEEGAAPQLTTAVEQLVAGGRAAPLFGVLHLIARSHPPQPAQQRPQPVGDADE